MSENDKIREAFGKEMFFNQAVESDNFTLYSLGYKSAMQSAQEEIERLKCCGNCGNKKHSERCFDCFRSLDWRFEHKESKGLDNWEAKR